MLRASFRALAGRRALSTEAQAATSSGPGEYIFSKQIKVVPEPILPTTDALRKGKGLMEYLKKTLPDPMKQKMIETLFSRRHPDRILPGSIITVLMNHAPTSFSGVLMSTRRRGIDTSFVLRNVVQRTGVEMQFFVNSPHVKDIIIVKAAGGGGGKEGRKMRRAKLFYLRDSSIKMTAIAGGVKT